MSNRLILRGTTWRPWFTITDALGAAVNMTDAARSLLLRLTKLGATSPALTRSTSTPAHVSWTSQSGGTGRFIVARAATAALESGRYRVEVFYADAEVTHQVYGPDEWRVETPYGGTP